MITRRVMVSTTRPQTIGPPEEFMTETRGENSRAVKVPEFLREPLSAAQAKLERFEEDAQRVFRDLMDRGRASRKDIEHIVAKLSKQDWTFPEMRQRLERLREQGMERAAEWRGKAETFRAEALERVIELQSKLVSFLGVATRDEVQEISKELDRLARRIAKADKHGRAKKRASSEG
jgi:polyhydroxyalkanoate synthesis regulator phasin